MEMARQLHFYRLANDLRSEANLPLLPPNRRDDSIPVENRVSLAVSKRIPLDLHDITEVFSDSQSDLIISSLEGGHSVLAIPHPGFSGRLGKKQKGDDPQLPRLGGELASAAKLAGVAGIFQSDELPAYGITQSEVDSVRSALSLKDQDAFAICIAPDWQAELALESVLERARTAFYRIPREVRNVVITKGKPEDGTTNALRPLPGGSRMYPETDVPILEITPDRWEEICENLPLTAEEREVRMQGLGLSPNQVEAIINLEIDDLLFEGIEGSLDLPSKAWASALLEHGTDKPNALAATVHLREKGLLTREGAQNLLQEAKETEINIVVDWMSSEAKVRGFVPADSSSIELAVEEILKEKADFVKERGIGAVGPLMGMVMKKLGGSADGKLVSQILRDRIGRD